MGGLPTGVQVDIEFTAGVWTNVTAYVDAEAGISIDFGRTDVTGQPQVASCSLRLDNVDGRFTPLNAASTYYPNLPFTTSTTARNRIRVSYASGASPRFVGYIRQWIPLLDGRFPRVGISATDRLDPLSRLLLPPVLDLPALNIAPALYFPMANDTLGTAVESTGNTTSSGYTPQAYNAGTGTAQINSFASAFSGLAESRNGVSLTGTSLGQTFIGSTSPAATMSAYSISGWIQAPQGAWSNTAYVAWLAVGFQQTTPPRVTHGLSLTGAGGGGTVAGLVAGSSSLNPYDDGQAHHFVYTHDWSSNAYALYVDGALAASGVSGIHPTAGVSTDARVTVAASAPAGASVTFGAIGVWRSILSPTQVADLYRAGKTGLSGDLSGTRIGRVLDYAGVSTSDRNIAAGQETLGPAYNLDGADVTSYLQSVAATESGGAAVFVDVDGKVRFNDRSYRSTSSVALTIDALADLDGDSWQPVMDDLTRISRATTTRPNGTPQLYADPAFEAAIGGQIAEDISTDASTDLAALNRAQYRVSSSVAALRIPKAGVDLLTAQNSAALYTALASVTIGSRARIQSIGATLADGTRIFPTTRVDGFVEGWHEDIGYDRYNVDFDLSPADSPARFLWSDTLYGRWQPDPGSMTLTGTITNAATSLQVTTATGSPTFSTSAGDYPLYIKIDQEILQVTAAPAGSASPQTLTVARAQLGTFADAHTAGATITLWPASAWTL